MKKRILVPLLGLVMLSVMFNSNIMASGYTVSSFFDDPNKAGTYYQSYATHYNEDSTCDYLGYGMDIVYSTGFGLNPSTGQFTGDNVGIGYISCAARIDGDYESYSSSAKTGTFYTLNYIHSMRVTLRMYINNQEVSSSSYVGLLDYDSNKGRKDQTTNAIVDLAVDAIALAVDAGSGTPLGSIGKLLYDGASQALLVELFDETTGNGIYIDFDQNIAGNTYQDLSITLKTLPELGVLSSGTQVKYQITTQVWIKEYSYSYASGAQFPSISVLGGGFTKTYTDYVVLTKA